MSTAGNKAGLFNDNYKMLLVNSRHSVLVNSFTHIRECGMIESGSS